MTATVIFYYPDKGYGYLRLTGTREEFHFRRSNLLDPAAPPAAGSLVTFVLRRNRQGYFADDVRPAGLA